MIFSMSTDLQTRRIVWTLNNRTAENGHPVALSSSTIAGSFADIFGYDHAATLYPELIDVN